MNQECGFLRLRNNKLLITGQGCATDYRPPASLRHRRFSHPFLSVVKLRFRQFPRSKIQPHSARFVLARHTDSVTSALQQCLLFRLDHSRGLPHPTLRKQDGVRIIQIALTRLRVPAESTPNFLKRSVSPTDLV